MRSHMSCYQEKTLSQRLEWALINRVATGASPWGRGESARSPRGMGSWGSESLGLLARRRTGGECRVLAQPCHRPVVSCPLLSLQQSRRAILCRGERLAPWWGFAPSSPQ